MNLFMVEPLALSQNLTLQTSMVPRAKQFPCRVVPIDPCLKLFSKTAHTHFAESSKAIGTTSPYEVESDSSDISSSDSEVKEGNYIPVKTK